MDDVANRSNIPPPLPPKTRKGVRPVQQQQMHNTTATVNGGGASKSQLLSFSLPEMRSVNLVAAGQRHIASSQSSSGDHVVKIRISPGDNDHDYSPVPSDGCIRISVGNADNDHEDMVRRGNSVADNFMKVTPERSSNFFYYSNSYACQTNGMVISSGQSSPSDTLDSGTCSDLDGSTPPPLPKKNNIASASSSATVTVTVNGNHHHRRTGSLTSSGAEVDSDDDAGSNISCDSLNGHELNGVANSTNEEQIANGNVYKTTFKKVLNANQNIVNEQIRSKTPPPPPMKNISKPATVNGFLPKGLLQDIRDRSAKLTIVPANNAAVKKTQSWREESATKKEIQRPNSTTPEPKEIYQKQQSSLYRLHSFSTPPTIEETPAKKGNNIVEERTYEERKQEEEARRSLATSPEPQPYSRSSCYTYEADRFYKFHLREHELDEEPELKPVVDLGEDETFAGLKDLLGDKDASATIRSAKGTVRGVKNRVRAGIATFLQFPDTKSYKEKEAGKVVLYSTTMGIVRETFQECLKVKKILRTLLVKYEERDVFMSREVQAEIRERMHCDAILVPQLFLEGQHVGDGETIERLNESGELRKLLKPFKSPDACNTCPVCGGFRLLPCSVCNGSKKSVHRNDFTAEFVALKCMNCDEVGLVRCYAC